MRNYELIKQIYKMASDYPYPIAIKELIEEQRPELKKEKWNYLHYTNAQPQAQRSLGK